MRNSKQVLLQKDHDCSGLALAIHSIRKNNEIVTKHSSLAESLSVIKCSCGLSTLLVQIINQTNQ